MVGNGKVTVTGQNRNFYSRKSSDHFGLLPEIFSKLKMKTSVRESSVDLKKILDEDLSKISKTFRKKTL